MRILIFILFVLTIASCKKENHASTDTLMESLDTSAISVAMGNFQNGSYGTVSGIGSIFKNFNGTYAVVLDSFSTTNGPDLYVYLSVEAMPVDFIEVAKLRSTNGKQVYPLSVTPDLSRYKYISIHCKAYNHLFGYAMLP